jgi:type IV pilus assembly protein PilA
MTGNRSVRNSGFNMIELVVVLAVVATLALLAMPTFQDKAVRDQIQEALPLADLAKAPVANAWSTTRTFPADNKAAALPDADKIVNNYVSSVAIHDGAIDITFGNRAHPLIKNKVLTLRPAVVEDAPVVPVTWVCGTAAAPDKMTVKGTDNTNVPRLYLPLKCRSLNP